MNDRLTIKEGQMTTTETVNGREYRVRQMETGEISHRVLLEGGWDGYNYALTGKRGATYLAFRCARDGKLHIITSLGF